MNSSFQTRCIILCALLVIALSVLSGRLVQIQLVDRHRYAESSRKAFHRVEKLPAIRGMIVDRREEPLAKSIPVSTVFVDKNHLLDPKIASFGLAYQEASSEPGWNELDPVKQRRRINGLRGEILSNEPADAIVSKHLAYAVGILARPLGMRREELREKIETSKGKWVPVVRDLPEDVADRLRETVEQNCIQGFEFENSIKRWYTSPNLATHLVGFTGEVEETDDQGKPEIRVLGRFGVEATMESYLAGRDGWREHCRDARGLVVPGNSASLMPPRAGLNVQLTIDMGLQAIIEEEMDACLREFKSYCGAVVLMDPNNGEVLALASRPHFDLNLKEDLDKNSLNFAIQGIYEPGSTFKLVSTSGVLNEGLATPFTTVFCHNGHYVEGKIEVPDHFPYGNLTLEGVLVKSSNIGAYKFARQLGAKRFYDYAHRFGFGRKTGIQLSGESSGIAKNTGNAVDFSRAAYGYALNVTPLQMACAYSVIAGNGKLLKPKIVKSLVANDGTVVEDFPSETVCEVMKPETARKMREALQKVTEIGGTATLAAVPGYKVAGKTGTAKRHNPNGHGYLPNSYTVSFVGMLPARNPAFVCVVVIDDPRTEKVTRYGGTIAAPAFGRIAARAATYLNLPPTEPVTHPLASAATDR
jgi:cell division protein FtsI/penicillin-binding protein 2